MLTESLLAYVHFIAILALVVFITSEAALCRPEWLNASAVHRLVRLDILYLVAAVAVLATGLARTWWGMKGASWYWSNGWLHAKVLLFVVIGLISIRPTLDFMKWRRALVATGVLPDAGSIRKTRRLVMIEAHLLILIPLAASLMARGYGN